MCDFYINDKYLELVKHSSKNGLKRFGFGNLKCLLRHNYSKLSYGFQKFRTIIIYIIYLLRLKAIRKIGKMLILIPLRLYDDVMITLKSAR